MARVFLTEVFGPVSVDVWPIALDGGGDTALLTPHELDRAARFRHDVHRSRFLARRSAVRRILAAYTHTDASTIAFATTCGHCGDEWHGRPRLVDDVGVEFAWASSGDVGVVAVARSATPVGVDVERVDRLPTLDEQALATTLPSSAVARAAAELDPRAALLREWARIEAHIKATGRGFVRDSPLPEASPANGVWLLTDDDGTSMVRDIGLDKGSVAAVAVLQGATMPTAKRTA